MPETKRVSIDEAMPIAWEQFRAGRLDGAESIARQVTAQRPDNPDAQHLLGIVAYRAGRMAEAIAHTEQASALAPRIAAYHGNLCEMYRQAGRVGEAIGAGERAVALDPRYAQALNNLGIAHFDNRDYAAAAEHYRRALAVQPDFPEAHNNLGNALRMLKQNDEAIAALDRAIALRPAYAEAHNNRASLMRDLGRREEAEASYRRATALRPTYVEAWTNLAALLWDAGKRDDAMAALSRIMANAPERVEPPLMIASFLAEQGKSEGALSAVQRALRIKPDNPAALNLLGRVQRDLEDLAGSIATIRRAVALKPDSADALNNLGISLLEAGDLDGARDVLQQALVLEPGSLRTLINLASAKKFRRDDPELAQLSAAAEKADQMPEEGRMQLLYALGKACDDVKDYERAFDLFLAGAAIKRKTLKYDEGPALRLFDRIRQVFTPRLIEEKRGLSRSSADPIFIVGMPRSGSTLIEQILASHPRVHGAGEVKWLHQAVQQTDGKFGGNVRYPEMMHLLDGPQMESFAEAYLSKLPPPAPGKDRFTDKLLTNYYYLGLIHLAMPNARIVHARRNPADTCISCFSKLFRDEMPYTYDLGEAARFYRAYDALMRHWHAVLPRGVILDVQYEQVVGDLEAETRRLLDFLGLEWNDACLAFHKTERTVKTASVTQVRQPLYGSSVERWRNYGPKVAPLIEALGPLAPGSAPPAPQA
jgi:tetratricopeptide (TPR) repeat protein